MKKLIKTTLLLALIVSANTIFANGDEAYINIKESKVFSVHHNTTSYMEVSIIDNSGLVLYRKSSTGNGVAKSFDLKELPVGNYTLEIEDDKKVTSYAMEVVNDGLSINKSNVSVFKPVISVNNRFVNVSMLKFIDGSVNMGIYNAQNELVFNDKINGESISLRYDLSKLAAGKYTLLFNVEGHSFQEFVTIK